MGCKKYFDFLEDDIVKGIKIIALALASSAVVISATSAFAACSLPTGFYVEGNVGASKSSGKSYHSTASASNSGLAWNVNAGYKFMPFLAVEGGASSYATSNIKNSAGTQFAKDRHYSGDVAVKGIAPVGDSGFEVFAKIGVAELYSSFALVNNLPADTAGYSSSSKNNSISPFYGLGADYYFLPTVGGSLQWQRVKGNSKTGTQDLYTIGIVWALY
jgi:hypothetical protein